MHASPEPESKAEVLELIQHYRGQLEATVASLNSDQLLAAPAGGWSIKDHLAHIVAWEQSLVALLQGRPRHEGLGVDKATYDSHDVDAVNDSIYRQNQSRPVDEVLEAFHSSHRQLLEQLAGMSDDDLRKPYSHYLPHEPGEETGSPILEWVAGNSYHHYAEHLEVIRELASP